MGDDHIRDCPENRPENTDDEGRGSRLTRTRDPEPEPEPPIKLPDPPDGEGGFTEPETPKVGSRDAPGG